MEELKNRCQFCGYIIFIGYKKCSNCKTEKTYEQITEYKKYWNEQRSK